MNTYLHTDSVIVSATCQRMGISPLNTVDQYAKIHIADQTGLSLPMIRKALTNIRKTPRIYLTKKK